LRALREAKAHAALNSRLSNRRQRTQGSDLGPLSHLRGHRGSYLARGQRFEERHLLQFFSNNSAIIARLQFEL
jgi:hypothetical protein